MLKSEEKVHLPKVSIDEFFTTQEERDRQNTEVIKKIAINDISNFPNHPYQVRDDEEMQDMVNNVKENGVIHPILVRPKQDGGYEIISGHRRKRACEKAGITEMPAIVREMTDEEAIIQMVDSNKQREKVLPSEKAFAYKMRLEAMNKQGKRTDLTSTPTESKSRSNEELAEEVGESREQIRRYIRLTELIPAILKLVDEEKMKLRPAVEISYLKKNEQDYLLEAIEYTDAFPSHPQAIQMRKLSVDGMLTEDEIDNILSTEKPNQKEHIKIADDRLEKYYPENVVSAEQKVNYVIHCVKETSEREKKQKQYVR